MYVEIASTSPVSYMMGNHGGACSYDQAIPLAILNIGRISAGPIRQGDCHRSIWRGGVAYIQPSSSTLTTRNLLMTKTGMKTRMTPSPLPSALETRVLDAGTAPSAGKRDKGGWHCRCWQIPCSHLSIHTESWYILIQAKIWLMFPGSGGNLPHREDASSFTSISKGEREQYGRGEAPQVRICCCFSSG